MVEYIRQIRKQEWALFLMDMLMASLDVFLTDMSL